MAKTGEKKKNNKGLIIINIILVMIILVIVLLIYIALDEKIITINKEKVEDIKVIENNEKEEEQMITDSNLIVDLKNKVNDLNANKTYMNHIIPNLYKEEKITYIDIEQKLHIVLESLSNSYTSITLSKEEIEKSIGSYYVGLVLEDNKEISISKVKERYKELFGTDINNFIHIEGCPTYLYDANHKVYYMTTKCTKGIGMNKEFTYDQKYTKKDNFAYVYMNVGTAFTIDNQKFNIYRGYSSALYKEEVLLSDIENFKINKDNYKDFDTYKYKFFKDTTTNNYYFISVEKIK